MSDKIVNVYVGECFQEGDKLEEKVRPTDSHLVVIN